MVEDEYYIRYESIVLETELNEMYMYTLARNSTRLSTHV